jgi:glucose dehydrogenase/mono/diheme cytochrome c family protein
MKKIIKYLFFANITFVNISYINANSDEWSHSSGSYKSERYSKNTQITEQNISNLNIAWEYSTKQIRENTPIQASPIYTGTKIVSVALDSIYALNPDDGSIIWETFLDDQIFKLEGAAKGITFIMDDNPKVYVPTNMGIVEISELDGQITNHFNSGASALPPVIYQDKIVIATRWEGVKAYDKLTKQMLWHLETSKNNYQSHIWSGFSFSKEMELLYIVTGSSGGITGWYRNDINFDNSLIAIDINTGEMVWNFKHIDHDLWDLDVVGNPMILDLEINSKTRNSVVALTKTGDVIFLDALTGRSIFEDSFEFVEVRQSKVPNEKTAAKQKKFSRPSPFTNTIVDIENDFLHLNKENQEYVQSKIRRAKSGFFIPPSLDHDVILYGLHGGAEWPGGSIDFSAKNPALIVPYNRDPWILRTYYRDNLYRAVELAYAKYKSVQSKFSFNSSERSPEKIFQTNCASCHESGQAPDKSYISDLEPNKILSLITNGSMSPHASNLSSKERSQLALYLGSKNIEKPSDSVFQSLPFTPNNQAYNENCSSCHGSARRGRHDGESKGDSYVPPLIGITLTKKNEFITNYDQVANLHNESNASFTISKEEYQKIFQEFHSYDKTLEKLGLLSSRGFWQVLLDKDQNPATKPPWGGIAKIDLSTGKEVWNIPFGVKKNKEGFVVANGVRNFGGLVTTATGLIFATGTTDTMAYAFNTDGKLIWSDKLPHAGSAQPISINHNGCQYIIFTATGGKWYDYKQANGDKIVAYKLNTCNEKLSNSESLLANNK